MTNGFASTGLMATNGMFSKVIMDLFIASSTAQTEKFMLAEARMVPSDCGRPHQGRLTAFGKELLLTEARRNKKLISGSID